jgi:hypothetical protein
MFLVLLGPEIYKYIQFYSLLSSRSAETQRKSVSRIGNRYGFSPIGRLKQQKYANNEEISSFFPIVSLETHIFLLIATAKIEIGRIAEDNEA